MLRPAGLCRRADHQFQAGIARQCDDQGDVGSVGGLDDRLRAVVEAAVEDRAYLVVDRIIWGDQPAFNCVRSCGIEMGGVSGGSARYLLPWYRLGLSESWGVTESGLRGVESASDGWQYSVPGRARCLAGQLAILSHAFQTPSERKTRRVRSARLVGFTRRRKT